MFRSEPLNLGLILFILGVAFWVGSLVLTRFTTRLKMQTPPDTPRMDRGDLDEQSDALITIQPGGRVYSLNAKAHELFHLNQDEIPNLERLSKRIRPSDTFLRMCVVEGQGRFILDGRPVDASAHRIAFGQTAYMLISLRLSELVGQLSSEQSSVSSRTLQTFTELTQKMASSLDLESAIRATLESIDKVLPAEYMQICIWDSDAEVLIPYRYHAFAHPERKLDRATERYVLGQGFNGQIAQKRQPLVIPILDTAIASQSLDTNLALVRSFLGVPLLVGKQMIGTLELGSLSAEQFQESDLQLLQIVSGQAAVSVHNALLYGAQQRRNQELTGLAQLSTAFIPSLDLDSTYARLLASIAPLVPVQIMGFLIYNDASRHLEGKVPFKGFPAQFLKMYRVEIETNSPMEKAFLDQDVIISENASQDPQWEALGISQLSKGASLRETALVPLVSGGRMQGYLQASNHTDGNTAFSQRELDLLTIIQQTRQRALRAEALRRITSLASSTATLDEILKFSLQELAELVQAEVGMVLLLDQDRVALKIDVGSLYGITDELTEAKTSLLVDDPQFPFTVAGRLHNFITDRFSEEQAVIPFYQQIAAALKIESMAAVPLVVRNIGVGEIILGSKEADSFDRTEMQVIVTVAGQVAAVVEQAYLREQTDESLRRRVEQMTALTRISRELSTTLNLDYLLQLLHQESLRTTGADCGTILLFDTQTVTPTLRQWVGCNPSEVLLPLELKVLGSGEMMVVHNLVETEYQAPHEGIHSLLCVPVFYQQKPIGVIQLHGKQPDLFDSSAIEFAQSLAVQATLALGNAMQYDQQIQRSDLLRRELDTINNLFKLFRQLRPDRPLEEDLQTIAQAIKDSTPFQVVLAMAFVGTFLPA
jgi:GAF domain-containing protein